MCVTTTTGAMVVAGSARTADRIRSRLDIAETCFPTAVHPAPTPARGCDLERRSQWGFTEEARRRSAMAATLRPTPRRTRKTHRRYADERRATRCWTLLKTIM